MLGFKKKRNKIAERIESLNDKLWLVSIASKKFDIITKKRYCEGLDSNYYESYKVFSLKTTLGERKIAVNKNSLYYGNADMIKKKNSQDVLKWSFDFDYIFKILIVKGETHLYPYPFAKMTKEEIDLAILEFEKAIDRIYQKVLGFEDYHRNIVDYLTGDS